MKEIVFDFNPLGNFSLSAEVYELYYSKKYNKKIYFYIRDGRLYKKVKDIKDLKKSTNRVITFIDLGDRVDRIPFDEKIRVKPIDEDYDEDPLLIEIVNELGQEASWKNSKIKVVEIKE